MEKRKLGKGTVRSWIQWVCNRETSLLEDAFHASGALRRYLGFRLRYSNFFVPLFSSRPGADIHVGPTAQVSFGRLVRFMHNFTGRFDGTVIIGNNAFFNRGCYISVRDSLSIGDNCLFGEYVSIHDNNHVQVPVGQALDPNVFTTAPIRIGSNVWIGAKSTILQGVTIGDNVVVGANSVVTRDIPAGSLAVGSPARILRQL